MEKLIVANWKMHPLDEKRAVELAKTEDKKGVVVIPPFPFLIPIKKKLKKAALGAQDLFWENSEDGGAFTGEVSAKMLQNIGVTYVIVGHSERRRHLGETDEIVNRKMKTALEAGLKVILCVGEDWDTRKKGIKEAQQSVERQLRKNLEGIKKSALKAERMLIAYEPVWAVDTDRAENPQEIAEIARGIKALLDKRFKIQNSKILYGGSVDGENARSIFTEAHVDGVLVGEASIHESEFLKILDAAHES